MDLSWLTRRHGIRLMPVFPCTVEDCSLAVGEVVGYSSVKSAARMNKAVVLFLDSVSKVNMVVESGVVVFNTHVPVSPLVTAEVRVTVANVPPFVKDEVLVGELSKHGRVTSQVRKMSSGSSSPLLKHVVSHRRQCFMLLHGRSEDLDITFTVRADNSLFIIYAKTDNMKCFNCGREGHQSRACPRRKAGGQDDTRGDPKDGEDTEGGREQQQEEAGGVKQVTTERGSGGEQVSTERGSGGKQVNTEGAEVGQQEEEEEEGAEMGQQQEEEEEGAEMGQQQEEGEEEEGAEVAQELEGERAGVVLQVEEEGAGAAQGGAHIQEDSQGCTGGQVEVGRGQEGGGNEKCGQVMEGESEVEMEEGEEKLHPLKRKAGGDEEGSQKKKGPVGQGYESESSMDDYSVAESGSSDDTECEREYSLARLKYFLKDTKNRKCEVEKHFTDLPKLILSIRLHMKNKTRRGFTRQEIYRLQKIRTVVNKGLKEEADSQAQEAGDPEEQHGGAARTSSPEEQHGGAARTSSTEEQSRRAALRSSTEEQSGRAALRSDPQAQP